MCTGHISLIVRRFSLWAWSPVIQSIIPLTRTPTLRTNGLKLTCDIRPGMITPFIGWPAISGCHSVTAVLLFLLYCWCYQRRPGSAEHTSGPPFSSHWKLSCLKNERVSVVYGTTSSSEKPFDHDTDRWYILLDSPPDSGVSFLGIPDNCCTWTPKCPLWLTLLHCTRQHKLLRILLAPNVKSNAPHGQVTQTSIWILPSPIKGRVHNQRKAFDHLTI